MIEQVLPVGPGAEGVEEPAGVARAERDAQDVGGVQQGGGLLGGEALGHGSATYASPTDAALRTKVPMSRISPKGNHGPALRSAAVPA